METLYVPLEFREDTSNASPGLLSGVLMRYEERARDRPELFENNAFYWPPDGILIRELHPKPNAPATPAIMRAMPFMEGKELRISAPLPNTTKGRDVAESMKGPMPLYGGLSVEFAAEKQVNRNGLRVISRAYLDAAALVHRSAYSDALVEVREGLATMRPWSVFTWL